MAFPQPKKTKRPHPGVPLDSAVIIDLVHKHKGNLSRVADAIGCARSTIQDKMNREPEIKKAVTDERERFVDELEDSCEHQAIHEKDTALKIFLLKTRARARGYEQDMNPNATQDIAKAAFDFVLNRTANPAES